MKNVIWLSLYVAFVSASACMSTAAQGIEALNYLQIKVDFKKDIRLEKPSSIENFIKNIKVIIDNELLIEPSFLVENNAKFILQNTKITNNFGNNTDTNITKISFYGYGVENNELLKFQFKNSSLYFEDNQIKKSIFGSLDFESFYSQNAGIPFDSWSSIFKMPYEIELRDPIVFDPTKTSIPQYRYGVPTNKYKYSFDTLNTNVQVNLDVNYHSPLVIKNISISQKKK
jgi:hypothetical protein